MTTVTELADRLLALLHQERPPLAASLLGIGIYDHRLPDLSAPADLARKARADFKLIEHTVAFPLTAPARSLLHSPPLLRPRGEYAERAYLTRLTAIPGYLADAAERHRAGIAAGRLPALAHPAQRCGSPSRAADPVNVRGQPTRRRASRW